MTTYDAYLLWQMMGIYNIISPDYNINDNPGLLFDNTNTFNTNCKSLDCEMRSYTSHYWTPLNFQNQMHHNYGLIMRRQIAIGNFVLAKETPHTTY